jgi:hypothetical protein
LDEGESAINIALDLLQGSEEAVSVVENAGNAPLASQLNAFLSMVPRGPQVIPFIKDVS